MRVDFRQLGADLMTISAHKIGGPMGAGALIARGELPLQPLVKGGGQERGRRAGTENLPGIVGFGAAARLAASETGVAARVAQLRDAAERRLRAIAPGAIVFGAGCAAPAQYALHLDARRRRGDAGDGARSRRRDGERGRGLLVRARSRAATCSTPWASRAATPNAPSASALGWSTDAADIDHLVEAWTALYARTRASAA